MIHQSPARSRVIIHQVLSLLLMVKSLATWDVSNPVNNGISYQPQLVIAGFLPWTLSPLTPWFGATLYLFIYVNPITGYTQHHQLKTSTWAVDSKVGTQILGPNWGPKMSSQPRDDVDRFGREWTYQLVCWWHAFTFRRGNCHGGVATW